SSERHPPELQAKQPSGVNACKRHRSEKRLSHRGPGAPPLLGARPFISRTLLLPAVSSQGVTMLVERRTRVSVRTVLALVFFLSGMASLIFQVAWQRLLTLHYGVGPVSVTLIVSVYMFGLGLGSLLGGFIADYTSRKLAWYLGVELALGVF